MNPFEILRNTVVVDPAKSIADQIYETLKNSIVRREIEPNQRLLEVEVATSFHASRTPVREAFRRLEQDGIAERLAQGGIRVPQLDAESIRDLFDLRVILEVYAMELACERVKPEDIAYLKQIRAQAEELLKTGDVSQEFTLNRFYELNSMFHDYIYSATRSKFLIKVLNNIRAMVMSMRSVSIRLDSIREVWNEHSRLIDHLERREKKAATRLIRQHVLRTASQVLSFVRSKKDDGSEIEGPGRRRSRKRSPAKH